MSNTQSKKRKLYVYHDDFDNDMNIKKKRISMSLRKCENEHYQKRSTCTSLSTDNLVEPELSTMMMMEIETQDEVIFRVMRILNTLDVGIYNFLKKCCFNNQLSSSDILFHYLNSENIDVKRSLRAHFLKNPMTPIILRSNRLLRANTRSFRIDVLDDTYEHRLTDGIISINYSQLDTISDMLNSTFTINKDSVSFLKVLIQSTYDFCEFDVRSLRVSPVVNMRSVLFSLPDHTKYFSNCGEDGHWFQLNVNDDNINEFIGFFEKATSLHHIYLVSSSMGNLSSPNQRRFYDAMFQCKSLKVLKMINGINVNTKCLFESLKEHSSTSALKILHVHSANGMDVDGCTALCEYIEHFENNDEEDTRKKRCINRLDLSAMKLTNAMLIKIANAFDRVKDTSVDIIHTIGLGSNLFDTQTLDFFMKKSRKHIKSLNYFFKNPPFDMDNDDLSLVNTTNVILDKDNSNLLMCKMCFSSQNIINIPVEKLNLIYNWNILTCSFYGFSKPDYISNIIKRNRDFFKIKKSFHFWGSNNKRSKYIKGSTNDVLGKNTHQLSVKEEFNIDFASSISDVTIICQQ